MMYKKGQLEYLIAILLLSSLVVSYFAFTEKNNNSKNLKVAYMDIGQGDSIYVEAPNGNQMIIDGGPTNLTTTRLAELMPFGNRSINILVVTNPDKDHYYGFLNIIKNYNVGAILEPGTISNSQTYASLENLIAEKKIPKIIARRGMNIILDQKNNVVFHILFPDRDVSSWTTNDGSIVGRITYGNSSYMMMGDATVKTEDIVLAENSQNDLKSDILKLGHHGSKTSSSSEWLSTVAPSYAVISAGLNNKYGHPHKEVLNRLDSFSIPYLITFQKGNIIFDSVGGKPILEN